jgi:hypothetical protein
MASDGEPPGKDSSPGADASGGWDVQHPSAPQDTRERRSDASRWTEVPPA